MLALKRILYGSATCCNLKSTVIYFIRIIILLLSFGLKEGIDSNKEYHTYNIIFTTKQVKQTVRYKMLKCNMPLL